MKRVAKLPELLAPAGSFEAMVAAIDAGADAVYFGGPAFHARAGAKNFDQEELPRAMLYCRLHGVRAYVTLNTLLFDRELSEALSYARALYRMGADALICADVGLMAALRQALPELPLHASTQASVHNTAGADSLLVLGVRRVVLAREVPVSDMRQVIEQAGPELEVFVHGALCVSYSGQCLLSSFLGGRSGNRGTCAQPCRLPYDRGYPLSLKDLSLAAHIPALIDSGVASLKIEGRMRSPSYVSHTTALYRRLLDEGRAASPAEMQALAQVFSRGDGFTDGYYTARHTRMTGVRTRAQKEASRALEADETSPAVNVRPRPVPLRATAVIVAGAPASLTLEQGGRRVCVTGDVPVPALGLPLTEATVKERLAKLGGTFFTLAAADIQLTLEAGLYLSPGQLNALRRAGVDALSANGREASPAADPVTGPPPCRPVLGTERSRTALFSSPAQWAGLSEADRHYFDRVYLPLWPYFAEGAPDWAGASAVTSGLDVANGRGLPSGVDMSNGVPDGISLPAVVFDSQRAEVLAMCRRAKACGVRYALVGNPGQLSLAREAGLEPVGDFRLNITNRPSAAFWAGEGLTDCILSPELTLPALRDIGGRVLTYGRVPLMLLERCPTKESGGCEACTAGGTQPALRDRRGVCFPLLREYPHRRVLCNSLPTYMGDRQALLAQYGVVHEHFFFSVETPAQCRQVIGAHRRGEPLPGTVRRIAK